MALDPWGPFGPTRSQARQILAFIVTVLLALAIWGAIGVLIACDPHPPTPPGPVDPVDPPDPEPVPTVKVYVGVYDLLGAVGDMVAFLDSVVANGGKGIRVMVCYSWQGPQTGGSPYLQVGTWKHENGDTFPLYRLSAWDENFWVRFNALLCAAAERGLEVWIVCEDYCSLKGDQHVKYFNPMYSSEEALGPDTPGGVWGDAMKPYHEALIDRSIAAAKAVPGLNFLIEPMNEYDAIGWSDDQMIQWHAWAVDVIRKRGVPLSRIVGTAGRQASAIAAQVGLYSPHGVGRPEQIVGVSGISPDKLIYSSDGFWQGQGPADCKGKRGPGLDVANAIGLKIITLGVNGYEYLPRDAYRQNCNRANVDGLDLSVIRAIAWAK